MSGRKAEALSALKAAPFLHDAGVVAIFEALDGTHHRTRVVGGAVRDTLMVRPQGRTDVDMATELLPDEVIARARAADIGCYPTGIAHGTVTLRAEGRTVEVTTLRRDVATDGRHAEVAFGTDWSADAARRDFTLNALYADADGALFDPLNGLEDCLAGRVRFIGRAEDRIAEDRLRVYRFFRFSASHGGQTFDGDGLAACRAAAGTLGQLSAERVGAEMLKMLALPRVAETLEAMRLAAILGWPAEAMAALVRYEQLAEKATVTGRLVLIGQAVPMRDLRDLWRLSNAQTARALAVDAAARLLVAGHLVEAAYRQARALDDALPVAAAVADWSPARLSLARDTIAALPVADLPVRGADLEQLGFEPGPALGAAMRALEAHWIESGFTLSKAALLDLAGPPIG